jgi:chloramphenicol O-acetyltransferase type A
MMVSDTGQRTMSMSVHVHHGLMDGMHPICGLLSRNYESIKNTIKISKARKVLQYF